jgi:hypothetical protein
MKRLQVFWVVLIFSVTPSLMIVCASIPAIYMELHYGAVPHDTAFQIVRELWRHDAREAVMVGGSSLVVAGTVYILGLRLMKKALGIS